MTSYKNRLLCTVSAVASSGLGAFTVSTASSGYVTFAAGDEGKSFDVVIVEGTAWEVRTGCVYTHSGTSLSRGTLEASSTGSAVAFTSAALLTVTPSAAAFQRFTAAALDHLAGTDAATSMSANTLYVVDASALTADRTYTLPATAAVGDRVGVVVSTSSNTRSVVLTAASGDTLNGVAGGTEWSRLFRAGEFVVMRCVAENATWVVESSMIRPVLCVMYKNSNTSVDTITVTKININQIDTDSAGYGDTTNYRINIRRAGRYQVTGRSAADSSAITASQIRIHKNGSLLALQPSDTPAGAGGTPADYTVVLAVGDYLELNYRHASGATRTYYGGAGDPSSTALAVLELPS